MRGAPPSYDACMRLTDRVRGAWQLLMLAWAVRFRIRGAYLTWRRETAFGSDPARWPPPAERRRAMLEYGAWVARMKALRRR